MTKIDTQPEALRLAHALDGAKLIDDSAEWAETLHAAAAELRRLHAENAAQAQQIAQDRADAARLDFIDSHKSGCIRLDDRLAVSPLYLYWRERGDVKTAREAIDMARAAASGAAQGDDHG